MAVLARYGFVEKYGDYIMFWLRYMCDFSSLSLARNDRIGHFDRRCFFAPIEKSHTLSIGKGTGEE